DMSNVPQMINNGQGINFKKDLIALSLILGILKIASLEMVDDSYYLKFDVANAGVFSVTQEDSMKWHNIFGHFTYRTLKHMYTTMLVKDMPLISEVDSKCEGCELEKSRRLSSHFPKSGVTGATHKL
ncbi:retrovirus-related pol polyprotein from transposon TNT 1-94, partial [Tanacetum coccineum]